MNPFPYMPLFFNDLLHDEKVDVMDTTQFGAYMLLLCKAWHQDPVGSLPDDDAVLARWARLSVDDFAAVKPAVMACFRLRSGRYHQKRMQQVFDDLKKMRREKSEAGRKAANAKWQKKQELHTTALRPHCDGNATTNSNSNTNHNSRPERAPSPPPPPPPNLPPDLAAAGGEELRRELFDCGVGEPTLSELAAKPGLSPLAVRLAFRQAVKEADRSATGLLITRIRAGLPPLLLTPKRVCELVNAGDVTGIGEYPLVKGCVGQNATGLHIFADASKSSEIAVIPPNRITPEALRLAPLKGAADAA